MKKTLLTVGAATAIIAPIAAAVSCSWGYEGRYEAEDDGELKLFYAFSEGGEQTKALKLIKNLWNKGSGHKNLTIAHINGGYKKIGPQLAQSFEAGDTKKLPNMIIDYPDTLGVLAKYEMTIPIANKQTTDLFPKSFMEINDQISGIKKGEGTFALPIAKSVDMATFNTPVFKRIWDVAKTQGIVRGDLPASWKETGDSNGKKISQELWPTISDLPLVNTTQRKISFDEISKESEKMLDFAAKVRPLFKPNKETYVLGLDSAVNFVYQAVYQAAGADYNKFIFSKSKTGYINYNWGSGKAKEVFDRVYGKLRKAIESKAIYLNVGGQYSSSLEVQHKIAVAYGSTAGYSHNFLGNETPIYKKTMFTSYTYKMKPDKTYNGYHNKLGKIDGTNSKINLFWDSVTDKELIYITSADVSDVDAKDKCFADANHGHPMFLVKMTSVSKADTTLQESEMEIMKTPTKYNASNTDGAEATLVQGPSLIGIHANKSEDKSVIDFSSWFMNSDIKITSKTLTKYGNLKTVYCAVGISTKLNTLKTTMKPYEIFAALSGYIVPTKTALNSSNSTKAQKLTFDVLKHIKDYADHHSFDNPVDDTTGTFRKKLETALGTEYTASKSNNHIMTAAELYETMNW